MPRKGQHDGMRCPKCKIGRMLPTKRIAEDDLYWIRRTRVCQHCSHRHTTTETLDGPHPETIFSDESIDSLNQVDRSGDLPNQMYLSLE